MARPELIKLAEKILKELRALGFKTDCWSVKGDGEATKDCDIAIDVLKNPNKMDSKFCEWLEEKLNKTKEFGEFDNSEKHPYSEKLCRFKFRLKERNKSR